MVQTACQMASSAGFSALVAATRRAPRRRPRGSGSAASVIFPLRLTPGILPAQPRCQIRKRVEQPPMAAAVPPAADEFILETRGLTKEFSGFTAVNNVDLKVRRGHIHALIGPNGAGKTTFFNLLTKFLIPTRGAIIYRGRDITRELPAQVARRGIVRSFQLSAVFPHLTALENVRIALQRSLGTSFHFWKREATLAVLDARARELLGVVDLGAFAGVVAVELPYGRK